VESPRGARSYRKFNMSTVKTYPIDHFPLSTCDLRPATCDLRPPHVRLGRVERETTKSPATTPWAPRAFAHMEKEQKTRPLTVGKCLGSEGLMNRFPRRRPPKQLVRNRLPREIHSIPSKSFPSTRASSEPSTLLHMGRAKSGRM
jgi:hypothetical protein